MMKAIWKDTVLAESENTVVVEGNHYFPPDDVKQEHLVESDYRTRCPWKGLAHYYHIEINGEKSENSAWSYPDPKEKARHIPGHFAFGKGVRVE